MNPYIGDRKLEPDEEPDLCETCGGSGAVFNLCRGCLDDREHGPCPDCCADDEDAGEPNEPFEE